jgi:hypothetical protein
MKERLALVHGRKQVRDPFEEFLDRRLRVLSISGLTVTMTSIDAPCSTSIYQLDSGQLAVQSIG